jgi:fibro-slime domain-containing protein
VLNDTEACDDGNKESGDGCYQNCLVVEAGFTCPTPGAECRPFAKCGDGVISPPEQCDDANTAGDDGCSASCKVEIGSKCTTDSPSTCSPTVCGDSVMEGAEGCDDGNTLPFDGCDARCQVEPDCTPGAGCTSSCGDGLVLLFKDGKSFEECDDGNNTSGDGCSDTCQTEDGYVCAGEPCEEINGACVLRVPVIFRDLNASFEDVMPDGSTDCNGPTTGNNGQSVTSGLVKTNLDADGKPEASASAPAACFSASSFAKWYRDVDGTNSTALGDIVLFKSGSEYVNRYDSATGAQYNGKDGTPLFFPLDGLPNCATGERLGCALADTRSVAKIPDQYYGGGWNNDPSGALRNFHFTSEVTYWFQYDAGVSSTLEFLGDDDVWVFVNGRLAVDLGGTHVPLEGTVTLSSANAATYGLVDGNLYEIKVFHAERKVTGSSFKLTLTNFDRSRSECLPQCGDGIVGFGEECDDGVNDGGYNECQAGCVLGGYCGDGIKQENESCDDNAPDAPTSCAGCRILVVK